MYIEAITEFTSKAGHLLVLDTAGTGVLPILDLNRLVAQSGSAVGTGPAQKGE